MPPYVEAHSGGILILVLFLVLMATLVILVPQLLRARQRKLEMDHVENMRALEQGIPVPPTDVAIVAAGRTAMLVPMVVVLAAATVTCFLIAYQEPNIFAVGLAVWCVAGIVSLAAITGGVALIGRLAQLRSGLDEPFPEEEPVEPRATSPHD